MPTTMCATLDEPHAPGADLVFCLPLLIAWKQLSERFGPLRMTPQPPLADALNAALLDPAALDPAWYVAGAGLGADGILEALRRELVEKFPEERPSLLPSAVAPDALLAYAFLCRTLRFPTPFSVCDGTFHDQLVAAFGTTNTPGSPEVVRARNAQVLVHDYTSSDDFVLELLHGEQDDRILVAQIPPEHALGATVRSVLDRLNRLPADQSSLGAHESLTIPRLQLDEQRSFIELAGLPLQNDALAERRFDEVKQIVRFRLDQGGASVRAEAVMLGFGPPPVTRSFSVRRPFLLLLIRRGARLPYLALWVETPTWMESRGHLPPVLPPSFGAWGPPS